MKKLNKSHFIRTFNFNRLLIGTSFMAFLAILPIKVVEVQMQNNVSSMLTGYLKIMGKLIGMISNTLIGLIVITVGMLLITVGSELIIRITKDSLSNWFYSILFSFQLRRFLMIQTENLGNGSLRIQQFNKAIKNSIIDVRNHKITYLIKLPNDMESQKSIFEIKGILREEISTRLPNYLISNFERYNQWLIIEGTRKS